MHNFQLFFEPDLCNDSVLVTKCIFNLLNWYKNDIDSVILITKSLIL